MDLIAKVSQVLPLQSGTSAAGNPWQKAIVIVEWTDGQFTKKLALSNMKQASDFAMLQPYQEYKFKVDVTSREYNGKWYTEANCFAWEAVVTAASGPAQPFNQPNNVNAKTTTGYAAQPTYPMQTVAPCPQPMMQQTPTTASPYPNQMQWPQQPHSPMPTNKDDLPF